MFSLFMIILGSLNILVAQRQKLTLSVFRLDERVVGKENVWDGIIAIWRNNFRSLLYQHSFIVVKLVNI